ncbi:HNH endonuclease [Salmonella enterica]|nr:HNH endonuclease [Salmonella enterica]
MQEYLKNYKIYEDGRVQRITKPKGAKKEPGYFLKPEITKHGYQRITLCYKGKTKRFLLHRLVALVHLPNPGNLPVINHIDGNPANNHVSNLEWCTYSDNEYHAYRILNKIPQRGENHYNAKLDENLVREIRNMNNPNFHKLQDIYGIDRRTISEAYHGKTWKHVI